MIEPDFLYAGDSVGNHIRWEYSKDWNGKEFIEN